MTWFIFAVFVAAMLDIAANLLLADSHGFHDRKKGFAALALVAGAFTCLSYAVRGLDLSVAYAMWGGFGILGTMLGGWFFLKQKPGLCAWLGALLLVCGITALKLS